MKRLALGKATVANVPSSSAKWDKNSEGYDPDHDITGFYGGCGNHDTYGVDCDEEPGK